MSRNGPVIYGPGPPEPENMVWIMMERTKKSGETTGEKSRNSMEHDMQSKSISSASLNHEEKKQNFLSHAVESCFETQKLKPSNDGSKFKLLSCYDSQNKTLTVWNHDSASTPKKFISHLTKSTERTTSCPSFSTLLSDSASTSLWGNK